MKEAVNWAVGDEIVVASTGFEMSQAEQFIIKDISSNKKTLVLHKAANFLHYGKVQTYSNDRKIWDLDELAEVGLLTRNIVIQGGSKASQQRYGGHIMIQKGGFAQIQGVEIRKMGQYGIIGRYPFHWHMLGETKNQYVMDCSIHQTYNRALTIHGTSFTDVKDNVAYDHISHGYFRENGSEYGNRLIGNLGLTTRKMSKEDATIPTDFTHVSTFWITNPDNTFRKNSAGGSNLLASGLRCRKRLPARRKKRNILSPSQRR